MKKILLTVATFLFTSPTVQAHDSDLAGLLQHPFHHQQSGVTAIFIAAIVILALAWLVHKSGAGKP